MTSQEIFDLLAAPFPTVSWRVGTTNKKWWSEGKQRTGQALAYIDARDVMDRFDSVVGPGNWQSEYTNAGNGATCCRIGILLHPAEFHWVWKSDGAGQTDVEGDKGQFSDAFKRAAVHWGVGRYLYDLPTKKVKLNEHWAFDDETVKELDRIHEDFARKIGWGGNDARHVSNAIRLVDSAIRHFCPQPSDALEFQSQNEGVLASMPKAAREHVLNTIARVGQRAAE